MLFLGQLYAKERSLFENHSGSGIDSGNSSEHSIESHQTVNEGTERQVKAKRHFRQAEDYLSGHAGEKSYPLAIKHYQKAQQLGSVKASKKLKWLNGYLMNEPSLKKRYRRDLMLAKEGDKNAQFRVGEMCEYGMGVAPNFKRALFWYKKAASKNSGPAQLRLGQLYSDARIGQDQAVNEQQALMWLKSAADAGQGEAQFKLAQWHQAQAQQAQGNVEELKSAFYWYEKSAQAGLAEAQMQAGLMLKKGEGTAVDYEQALHWFEQASEQGHPSAAEQVKEVNTILDDIFLENFE